MNEIDKTNLTNETKFRLNEISKFDKNKKLIKQKCAVKN